MLKITQCKEISSIDFPQPLFGCVKIATANHEEYGDFSVYTGLSEKYAGDIKKYSQDLSDTALQSGTSDYKRFGTSDYKERYKAKPRTQLILVHDNSDEIAAFIWFGERDLPQDLEALDSNNALSKLEAVLSAESSWFTSSYRTYGTYRGARIASTFAAYVLDLYRQLHPNTSMWLAVQMENEPAIGLYKKLNFKVFAKDVKESEYIMKLT